MTKAIEAFPRDLSWLQASNALRWELLAAVEAVVDRKLDREAYGVELLRISNDLATESKRLRAAPKGLSAVFGKWPGDESEEQLINAMQRAFERECVAAVKQQENEDADQRVQPGTDERDEADREAQQHGRDLSRGAADAALVADVASSSAGRRSKRGDAVASEVAGAPRVVGAIAGGDGSSREGSAARDRSRLTADVSAHKDSRRSPGGDKENMDPVPTERHSGQLGIIPGHCIDDVSVPAGEREPHRSHDFGAPSALTRRCRECGLWETWSAACAPCSRAHPDGSPRAGCDVCSSSPELDRRERGL